MPAWEERIDRSTSASLLVEHVARYTVALPLIEGAGLWADLGCGTGVGARDALEESGKLSADVLLVDNDEAALDAARGELASHDPRAMRADLAAPDDLARLEAELAGTGSDDIAITCFEVFEHLSNFAPLLDLLTKLAEEHAATVVVSVPNDAFWSLHNPYHQTTWGGEAFEEFRSVLPREHVLALQHPVEGTCIARPAGETREESYAPPLKLDRGRTPSHYLAAFGPRADLLGGTAAITSVDLDERRAWERAREADLSFLREREAYLAYYEGEAKRLQEELDTRFERS